MINLKVVLNYTTLLKSLFSPFSPGFFCCFFLCVWTSIFEFGHIQYCKQGFPTKINNRMANSVDPDEMAHNEPSHPDLHCFQRYLFLVCRLKWLKRLFRLTYEKYGRAAFKRDLRTYTSSEDPDQPAHPLRLFRIFAVRLHNICITKTCQNNFDPLKPHFQYSKTGVYRGIHYLFYFCSKT